MDYHDHGAEIKSSCIFCLFVFTSKIRSPLITLQVFLGTEARVILKFCYFHTSHFVLLNDHPTGYSLEALSRESVWFCSKNMRWKMKYVTTTTKKRGCAGSQCISRCTRVACWQFPRALVLTEGFSGTAVARELAWHPVPY